ncbi:MAG: FABP family protein [Propionibacteriaceae bacterium]|jgi:hypothetical protein|nr:FABP family protein [Propionibacteriaceae bacterium]
MAFEIPEGLAPVLLPIAWLIGHWEGTGRGKTPEGEEFDYSAVVDFTENGQDWLHYAMQLFETDADGAPLRPLGFETGFWRPAADGAIEVLIAQPEGVAEVYLGRVQGAKIELATDIVVRTATAAVATSGGHRLYGCVESDLLFTYDRGTADADLQPWLWARLRRA